MLFFPSRHRCRRPTNAIQNTERTTDQIVPFSVVIACVYARAQHFCTFILRIFCARTRCFVPEHKRRPPPLRGNIDDVINIIIILDNHAGVDRANANERSGAEVGLCDANWTVRDCHTRCPGACSSRAPNQTISAHLRAPPT